MAEVAASGALDNGEANRDAIRDEVLAAVRQERAAFEAAARRAEDERSLPADVVDLLRSQRLFWLKTPSELGGSELDPAAFCDVLEELAYYDASAAWAAMVGNGTTGVVAGWLPEEGIGEVFAGAGTGLPVCAGQFTPRGTAVPVDGGDLVTGRWSFCSGMNHSEWLAGGCTVAGRDGALLAAVVPKSEATLHDTWYAAGLQGTGSGDFSLTEVFVPAARTVDLLQPSAIRGGDLFRLDPLLFVSNELSPVVVGIARRAVDDMVALAARTARGAGGVALSERVAFHKSLSRAECRLRAVQLLYRTAVAETWAATGADMNEAFVTAVRAQHTFVVEECEDLVGDIFRYGGGRVIALSHPMQRHLRNLTAAAQHVYVTDENYELAGRARLAGTAG
jgi:alkylation response protein AidB-like acyl-CoA dehydrogenase